MSAEKLKIEELGVDLISGDLSERLSGDLPDEEVEKVSTELSRTDRELIGKGILAEVERKRIEDAMLDAGRRNSPAGYREYDKLRDHYQGIGSPDFERDMNQKAAKEFATTHLDQLDEIARKEMDDDLYRKSHPQL